MREMPLPLRILQTHKLRKNFWRDMDALREKTKPSRNVYIDTIDMYRDYLENTGRAERDLSGKEKDDVIRSLQLLAALGAWRPTQDVVRFEPEIYGMLLETDFGKSIPSQILTRMPAWSIWFDTPYGFADPEGVEWKGFFASLDGKGDRVNFMFIADDPDEWGHTCRNVFYQTAPENELFTAVVDPSAIYDGISPENLWAAHKPEREAGFGAAFRKAVSLLLYVCVNGLEDRPGALSRPLPKPVPVKTKKGWRLFPAASPAIRQLGRVFAETLEKAREGAAQAGSGHLKRPHMRRAHWHGFWLGARDGERHLDLRWMPPMAIAAKNAPRFGM